MIACAAYTLHFALCTVIVQFVSVAVQSGEGLRASLMSRHFAQLWKGKEAGPRLLMSWNLI